MRIKMILFMAFVAVNQLFSQATEPTTPSGLQFYNIKAYTFSTSFNGSGANGYLILRSKQNITGVPVENQTYELGQSIGNAKVHYLGPLSIHTYKNVRVNETYHFAIYAYNEQGSFINYSDQALSGVLNVPDIDFNGYYNSVSSLSPSFVDDLKQLINPHQHIYYSDFKSTIIPAVYERDTTGGQRVVNCEYSNEFRIYNPPFEFSGSPVTYSREHIIPRSWMPSNPTTNDIEGADYHNLALCNLSDVNSVRLNHPFGKVVNITDQYLEAKLGYDTNGDLVYEPRDEFKGDVARALFYMMVCYNGKIGSWAINNLESSGSYQLESILKAWHQQDPPSNFEKTRHEYVFSQQNNRNPFIDHPEWVDCIDFVDLSKNSNCPTDPNWSSIASKDILPLYVSPNPSIGLINLSIDKSAIKETRIMSLNEKVLQNFAHENRLILDNLAPGVYYIQVIDQDNQVFRSKFILLD